MNRTVINFIYLVLFSFCLAAPAIKIFFSQSENDTTTERRQLNAKPNLPKNLKELKNWPAEFDRYYQDNFGFRDYLLLAYHQIKYFMRDSTGTDVIYGKEPGWLFYNESEEDPVGDYRNLNQFDQRGLDDFINKLKTKQQKLAEQGIEYLFIITPSKHYIYPEYLPDHLTRLNKPNMKQQLAMALSQQTEINYMDLTETLTQHKSNQLLYFKADTHWNYYAGNIAQHSIIEKINTIFGLSNAVRQWQPEEFRFQFNHQGDLAFLLKVGEYFAEPLYKPDFSPCAEVGFDQLLKRNSQYTTHCDATPLSVLVYHDSFFNILQPFVSSHFSRVQYSKQRFKYESAEADITKIKPDIVVEQVLDRILPTAF